MGIACLNRSQGLIGRGALLVLAVGCGAVAEASDSLRVDGRVVRVDALVAVDTLASKRAQWDGFDVVRAGVVRGGLGAVAGGPGWAAAWGKGVPAVRAEAAVEWGERWSVALGGAGTLVPRVDPAAVPDSCIGFLPAGPSDALRAVVRMTYPLGIETDTVALAPSGVFEFEVRAGVARLWEVGERGLVRAGAVVGRTLTPTTVQTFGAPTSDGTRSQAFQHVDLPAGRWVPRLEVGLARTSNPRAGCRAPRWRRPAVGCTVGFEPGVGGVPDRWTAAVVWTPGSECRR